MLTLLQLITRMINLEYSKEEVTAILDDLAGEAVTITELFDILSLELPKQVMLDTLVSVLPKRQSAINIAFLRAGVDETI